MQQQTKDIDFTDTSSPIRLQQNTINREARKLGSMKAKRPPRIASEKRETTGNVNENAAST